MRLKDKTAIVTGGSSGIGKAIAERYAAEGANVVIVNRSAASGQAVADEITAKGGSAISVACDVTQKADTDAMAAAALDAFGSIDIVMQAAGAMINKPVEALTEDDWNTVIDSNMKGILFVCQAVIPTMKQQGSGKIILTASIAGSMGYATGVAYCASKGGVLMMMRALTAELAQEGINVNCISPGATATPLNQEFRDNADFVAMFARDTPTGRDFVPPDNMAGAAVFLASDDAHAVHGLNLVVDDGWSAVKPTG